ncbi:MAG: hypothetical protein AAF677_02545 [Pseudomonadota bacterium]
MLPPRPKAGLRRALILEDAMKSPSTTARADVLAASPMARPAGWAVGEVDGAVRPRDTVQIVADGMGCHLRA